MADALGVHGRRTGLNFRPSKNTGAFRNPIDHFIQARLEREGLVPSAEADRRTLLRRLSFDLTGLPPTLEEVDAFLKDKSPDAYEKQVDRLLASPHYGERMAMDWLDVARYADTHGYHIDSHRDMWPWRDWVIKAFNANMPFDKFTILQLAGDLLPDAGMEGKDRQRLQPQSHDQLRRRRDSGGVSRRVRGRSRRNDLHCLDGPDDGLRPMPHAQVRSHLAQGVLPVLRVLQQRRREGSGWPHGQCEAVAEAPDAAQEETEKELEAGIKTREAALDAKEVTDAMARWRETLTGKSAPISRDGLSPRTTTSTEA